jgi:hypothetical protein
MTRREAMAIWEREHPWDKVSWWLMLSFLIKIPDGITTPRAMRKYRGLERFNDEGIIGEVMNTTISFINFLGSQGLHISKNKLQFAEAEVKYQTFDQ